MAYDEELADRIRTVLFNHAMIYTPGLGKARLGKTVVPDEAPSDRGRR